ncbi:MAG: L-fucose:H+ symporter permease [Bacteroidales bacterium]|nr:L-fucose:H+ symporter permease [Bacteroidales bacterium]
MNKRITLLGDADRKRYLLPFILVTSLFFFWGFAHSLLDVLNKHFQEILHVSRAESGLVQFSVYGGYFLAALPAGYFMNRFGYKRGIVVGLLLYALGAFFFYPAASMQTFWPFLTALLIIAFGLAFLETAANPYISVLGPKESAERRLNFSQSFNGLGWIFGPLVGGMIIFGMTSADGNQFTTLTWPYLGVGFVVLAVAILFIRTPLPEIVEDASATEMATGEKHEYRSLWSYPHFVLAVVAQFFYVAAQTGINSFFINYVTESIDSLSNATAAIILSFGGMGLFWAGRLSGSALMRSFKPHNLLALYAAICMLLMALVVMGFGWISIVALFTTYFFMSIMFPTIFVLGLKGLGVHTKKASSYLVMAIVGGALAPILMGYIADQSAMQWGYVVPLACFAFILYFGKKGYKVR